MQRLKRKKNDYCTKVTFDLNLFHAEANEHHILKASLCVCVCVCCFDLILVCVIDEWL